MAESRDYSLPGGMKNLIDLVEQKQQNEQAYQKSRADVRTFCRDLAPVVFNSLAQQIDPDLLYTEERDLIMPKLQEVARRGLRDYLITLTCDSASSGVVDILAHELWLLICLKRPFRRKD
jgi:hypothetical protein